MDNKKRNDMICMIVCIVLTTGVIAVLIWLLVSSKDKFCGACQGVGTQVNTNRPLLHRLYNKGILTENSELERGNQWKYMPWDRFINYPPGPRNTCS